MKTVLIVISTLFSTYSFAQIDKETLKIACQIEQKEKSDKYDELLSHFEDAAEAIESMDLIREAIQENFNKADPNLVEKLTTYSKEVKSLNKGLNHRGDDAFLRRLNHQMIVAKYHLSDEKLDKKQLAENLLLDKDFNLVKADGDIIEGLKVNMTFTGLLDGEAYLALTEPTSGVIFLASVDELGLKQVRFFMENVNQEAYEYFKSLQKKRIPSEKKFMRKNLSKSCFSMLYKKGTLASLGQISRSIFKDEETLLPTYQEGPTGRDK